MARPSSVPPPGLSLERALAVEWSVSLVAGVDEAGRGALAGPVFAAAVILPIVDDSIQRVLRGVRDSKLLAAADRERLVPEICRCVASYGIGSAAAEWIDQFGILSATRRAMSEAVSKLSPGAEAILVDGPLRLVTTNLPQRPIIRGDRQSLSIAAASILAKVSRDRFMTALGEQFPEYGFGRHKGYGTAEHLAALGHFGPCPEHRRSFAPLRLGLF